MSTPFCGPVQAEFFFKLALGVIQMPLFRQQHAVIKMGVRIAGLGSRTASANSVLASSKLVGRVQFAPQFVMPFPKPPGQA